MIVLVCTFSGSSGVSSPSFRRQVQNRSPAAAPKPPATEEGITDKGQGLGKENPGGEPFAVCADCGSKFSGAHGVLRCEEGCGKAYCKACARFDRSPCGTGQVPEPPHIFDQLMHRDRDRARAGESTGAMPPPGDSGATRSGQT